MEEFILLNNVKPPRGGYVLISWKGDRRASGDQGQSRATGGDHRFCAVVDAKLFKAPGHQRVDGADGDAKAAGDLFVAFAAGEAGHDIALLRGELARIAGFQNIACMTHEHFDPGPDAPTLKLGHALKRMIIGEAEIGEAARAI